LTQSEKALISVNGEKTKRIQPAKAQMNIAVTDEHYLFNSLNSINDFIISQNPMEASNTLPCTPDDAKSTKKTQNKMFNT
jgi:LytS/YehU family sensor histidine kinase